MFENFINKSADITKEEAYIYDIKRRPVRKLLFDETAEEEKEEI